MLLKEKPEITESDIETALSAYGDNYSAFNAIRGIAKAHNINDIGESVLDALESGLMDARKSLEKMINVASTPTKGVIELFKAMNVESLPDAIF